MLKIYAAGAGTGKTYRIVEDIIEEVSAGTPIDQVAAITFTELAAAELKTRLREKLAERGLTDQVARLDGAYISTVHGFCLTLLKEHPLDSGITESHTVLDEVASENMLRAAIASSLKVDELGSGFQFLCTEVFKDGRDSTAVEQVEQATLKVINFARSLRKSPKDFAEMGRRSIEAVNALLKEPISEAEVMKTIQECVTKWDSWSEDTGASYKYIRKNEANINLLRAMFDKGEISWETLMNVEFDCCGKAAGYPRLTRDLNEQMTAVQIGCSFVRERLSRSIQHLFRLAASTYEHYEKLKRQYRALDFSDMETKALDLLDSSQDDTPFPIYLQGRIKLLVVDEFQDTSPIQFRLLESIRGNKQVKTHYVGDIKQAIYGFRQADHKLMQDLMDGNEVTVLGSNWRSRPELVNFANALFGAMLPKHELSYDPVDAKSDYTKPGVRALPDPIEVLYLSGSGNAVRRARAVAHRVNALLNEGAEVWDKHTKTQRKLTPNDIAIIAKDNGSLGDIANALSELRIPAQRQQTGYFSSRAVQLLRALLIGCSNLRNTLSLGTLLVSELYGLSHAALTRVAEVGMLPKLRLLAYRFEHSEELPAEMQAAINALTPEEQMIFRMFCLDITQFNNLLRSEPLDVAVNSMLQKTDFIAVMAKTAGKQQVANAKKAVEIIHTFCHMTATERMLLGIGAVSVHSLIEYLARLQFIAPDMEQPVAGLEKANGVHLLTIHRSKGLEFPVVFWVSGHKTPQLELPYYEIVKQVANVKQPELLQQCWVEVFPPSGCKSVDTLLCQTGLPNSQSEMARLLYVTVTRAREKFVVVWHDNVNELSFQSMLHDKGNMDVVKHGQISAGREHFTARIETLDISKEGPFAEAYIGTPSHPDEHEPEVATVQLIEPVTTRPEALLVQHAPVLLELVPSSISDYLDCPAQYYLVHRRGVGYRGTSRISGVGVAGHTITDFLPASGAPPQSLLPMQEFGNLLHDAVFALAPDVFREENQDDLIRAKAARICSGYGTDAVELSDSVLSLVKSLRSHFAANPVSEWRAEEPILTRLGGTVIQGVLDLVAKHDDGWHVYDYKVTEHTDLDASVAHYRPQLELYAYCFEQATGEPVSQLHLVFANHGKMATFSPAAERDSATGAPLFVTRALQGIAEQKFERHPERDCAGCSYSGECHARTVEFTAL